MSKFEPKDNLEFFVISLDNQKVIESIVNGTRLSRADVFGQEETYSLTPEALMVLAYMGLPKEKRQEAIDLEKKALSKEPGTLERTFTAPNEGGRKEKQILNAIKKGTEQVDKLLLNADGFLIKEIPDDLIPCLAKLDLDACSDLFHCMIYPRTTVLLLKKLLLLTDDCDIIPEEVTSLGEKERKDLIDCLMKSMIFDKENWRSGYNELKCIDFVKGVLDEGGIPYEADKKNASFLVFKLPATWENKPIFMMVDAESDMLCMNVAIPFDCPENKRKDVAEFFMRVNYNVLMANFGLDMDDGEMFLKQVCPCSCYPVDHNYVIASLLRFPCGLLQQVLPRLSALIKGKATPEQAALNCPHD